MDRGESNGEVVGDGDPKPSIAEADVHPGALSNVAMSPSVRNISCWCFYSADYRRGEPCRDASKPVFWVWEHTANSSPHAGPLKTQGAA